MTHPGGKRPFEKSTMCVYHLIVHELPVLFPGSFTKNGNYF